MQTWIRQATSKAIRKSLQMFITFAVIGLLIHAATSTFAHGHTPPQAPEPEVDADELESAEPTDLDRLIADIFPTNAPPRPPYQLGRYDVGAEPTQGDGEDDVKQFRVNAVARQERLEGLWQRAKVADGDKSPAAAANRAISSYAFGEAELDATRRAARKAGQALQLRLAQLLLAECEFDAAADELIALADGGDGDCARAALALLVRHQVERETLERYVDMWPLTTDVDAYLKRRAANATMASLIAALRASVSPKVDPNVRVRHAARNVGMPVEEIERETVEPDEIDLTDIESADWAMEFRRRTNEDDSPIPPNPTTIAATNALYLVRQPREFVLYQNTADGLSRDRAHFKLRTVFHGPTRFRLYQFHSRQPWSEVSAKQLAAISPVREWSTTWESLSYNNHREVIERDVEIAELNEGYYTVVATARGTPIAAACSFVVNHVALYLRAGDVDAAVVAVDRRTGKPAPNVEIDLALVGVADIDTIVKRAGPLLPDVFHAGFRDQQSPEGVHGQQKSVAELLRHAAEYQRGADLRKSLPDIKQTVRLRTDSHGLARATLDSRRPEYVYRLNAKRVAPSVAATDDKEVFNEAATESTVEIGLGAPRATSDERKTIIWFAQPIHRLGDAASFQGMVRNVRGNQVMDHDSRSGRKVRVDITDFNRQPIWSGDCELSAAGTFSGSFIIPSTARLGPCRISVDGERANSSAPLVVAAFRTSTFKVDIKPSQERYAAGDLVDATVSVTYHSGKPAVGVEVEVAFSSDESGGESGDESDERIRLVTDDQGRARITRSIRSSRDTYVTLTATAIDGTGQAYTDAASIRIMRAPFRVDIAVDEYLVSLDEPVVARIKATAWKGAPLVGAIVAVDGLDRTFTTDAQGVATATAPSPSREAKAFQVAATVIAEGKSVRAVSERMAISTGKRRMRLGMCRVPERIDAGQTLQIRLDVLGPAGEEATVALFVENDRMLDVRVLRLPRGEHTFYVPTKGEWAPGVNVTALMLDGARVVGKSVGTCYLRPCERMLTLAIETDKTEYRPGDACTATIRATDHLGKPVAGASISLGVVDEAIYQIREDATPDLLDFFFKHEIQSSFRDRFDPGEFPWRSTFYITGPRYAWGFYSTHGVGEGDEESGFGGRGKGQREAMVGRYGGTKATGRLGGLKLRKDFRTTAHWVANLTTDAEGRARLSFKFPDNITNWRFTARGATARTLVGEARLSRSTTLPIQVEVAAVRVLRDGDRIELPVVLHNNTSREREVSGETRLAGSATPWTKRTIAPNAFSREVIPLHAQSTKPIVVGAAIVDAAVKDNDQPGDADSIERTLKPLPRGNLVTRRASGKLDRESTFDVDLGGTSTSDITLVLRRESGLAAVVGSAVDELIDYPYGCVEQTMSRFMPAVIAARAMREAKIEYPGARRLPKVLASGLERLAELQHLDGGWGWFDRDETSDFMTAYVLEGMVRCRDAGVPIADRMFDRGREYLESSLLSGEFKGRSPGFMQGINDRLYVLHALAALSNLDANQRLPRGVGRNHLPLLNSDLGPQRREQIVRSLAAATLPRTGDPALPPATVQADHINAWMLADAYRLLGDEARARRLLEELVARQPKSLAARSLLIELGASIDPTNDRWRRMADTLVAERRGPGWGDTLATASAVRGLSAVIATEQQQEETPVAVRLDGRDVGELSRRTANRLELKLTQRGKITLHPARDGRGDYFSASWHGYRESIRDDEAAVARKAPRDALATIRASVLPHHVAPVDAKQPDAKTESPVTGTKDVKAEDKKLDVEPMLAKRGERYVVTIDIDLKTELSHARLTWPRPCGLELVQGPTAGNGHKASDKAHGDSATKLQPSSVAAIEERDDAVHFFIEHWPAGRHQLQFIVRPEITGEFSSPDVELEPMYGDTFAVRYVGAPRWKVTERANP